VNNHKHSLQKRKYYLEINTLSLLQSLTPRATITTLQPALCTPNINVNIAFSCIAYLHPEDGGSTLFRNADATYQTTRRHTPEHRNLHIRNALQAVCVNAGRNPQRIKNTDKTKQCVKEDKYLQYFVAFCQSVTSMRLTKQRITTVACCEPIRPCILITAKGDEFVSLHRNRKSIYKKKSFYCSVQINIPKQIMTVHFCCKCCAINNHQLQRHTQFPCVFSSHESVVKHSSHVCVT